MVSLKVIMAFLYDCILLLAVWFFAAIPFVLWQGEAITSNNKVLVAFQAYLLAVAYAYLTYFWTRSGQTPGLKTWHLRLETDDGYLLSRARANQRFFMAALLFWIGWIGLFLPNRQTLQDRLSQTRIVTQ